MNETINKNYNEQQRTAINLMSPSEQFAFYTGINNGVMMVANTLLMKYENMNFEQYQLKLWQRNNLP